MPDRTLRVVARLVARPEKIDEVRSLLSALVEPTRAEPGCIAYELLHNKQDPTDFTFVEEWTDTDALYAHLHTPHVREAIELVPDLLAGEPDIRSYDVVN